VLDLERYASLDFLDASPYEYYNTHIKQGYRLGSKRKATALEETVQKLQDKVPATIPSKCDQNPSNQLSTQLLVREGFTSTQRELKELVNKLGSGKEDITQYNSKLQTELLTAMNPRDVHVFSNLLSEELATHNINVVDDNINITVVKSGYIDSYSVPSLNDYDEKTNKVRFTQVPSNQTTRKRVFATSSFGPSKLQRHSFVFLKGCHDGGGDEFWFAQVILLFHINCEHIGFHNEYALIRFLTCTNPVDAIDKELNCVCLRWETSEESNSARPTDPHPVNADAIVAGENYGLVPFSSLCGTVHLVRANYAIHPFMKEIPWTEHRFYVNRFLP